VTESRHVVVLLAAFLVAAGPAKEIGGRATARELLKEGNDLFAKGQFAPALARYQAAYGVYPNPKLLFNIGASYEGLEDWVNAAENFERFISTSGLGPNSSLQLDAQRRLARLDQKLAKLVISSDAAGAEVFIDGNAMGRQLTRTVRVTSGQHRIEARLEGYSDFHREVFVAAGETTTVKIEMGKSTPEPVPGPSDVAVAAPPPPAAPGFVPHMIPGDEERPKTVWSEWWFWTILGAGVVGVATVTYFAIHRDPYQLPGSLGVSSFSDWSSR
jgi:hypothetical protein